MKRSFIRNIIDSARKYTPLRLRRSFGPAIGYGVYFFNNYVRIHKRIPNVLSIDATIDKIQKERLSVVRFGDGEMTFIDGGSLAFQAKDAKLASRLADVLRSREDGLLVCVPAYWGKLQGITSQAFWFTIHHLFRYGHIWEQLLSSDQVYGNAAITRFYLGSTDKSRCGEQFKSLFSIWEGADVVLIEGVKSRLGVGNDMFDNTASMQRVLCPAENAFEKYDAIKDEALKIDKNKLILVSLGPAAKPLVYDLFMAGYRVIDIGHIDMEYEMFLRNEPTLVKVPYKYFNEIGERNPDECRDPKYIGQIIATIV